MHTEYRISTYSKYVQFVHPHLLCWHISEEVQHFADNIYSDTSEVKTLSTVRHRQEFEIIQTCPPYLVNCTHKS